MRIFLVLLALTLPASAKDVMLVLNDQEQAALRHILDSATKSEGLQVAQATVYLLNKLNTAPEVTERKNDSNKEAPP